MQILCSHDFWFSGQIGGIFAHPWVKCVGPVLFNSCDSTHLCGWKKLQCKLRTRCERVRMKIVYEFLLNNLIVQFFVKISYQNSEKFLRQSKTMSCSAFSLTWLITLSSNCLLLQWARELNRFMIKQLETIRPIKIMETQYWPDLDSV